MKHVLLNIVARFVIIWQRLISRKRNSLGPLRSILLIESTRLGDVVAALRLVDSLRDRFPPADITIAVRSDYVDLCKLIRPPFSVIALEHGNRLRNFIREIQLLRTRRFDLVCSLSPSHFNGFLALSASSPVKIGYFTSWHQQTPSRYRHKVESVGLRISQHLTFHRMNIYQRIGLIEKAVGIESAGPGALAASENGLKEGKRLLKNGSGAVTSPIIIIHVSARWIFREWPIHRFISLVSVLKKEIPSTIVITGLPDLCQSSNGAAAEFHAAGAVVLDRHIDLGLFAGLLSQASLYVGNDSGPLHLAASLGVPTIGLYGPASPELTAPPSPSHRSLYCHLDCSPCEQLRCVRPAASCMPLISVDEVAASALAILSASPLRAQA